MATRTESAPKRLLSRREALGVLGVCGASAALLGCGGTLDASVAATQAAPEVDDRPATTDAATSQAQTTAAESEPPAATTESEPASATEALLASMTLEQKVAQLFFVTPEQLTDVECATIAGPLTEAALAELPVGGLIYFSQNIRGQDQLRDLLSGTVALSRSSGAGVPVFTGVDEEGGPLVARVANSGLFEVERFGNMADVGATGDDTKAAYVGATIGAYLHDIGFSVDFAPDADVLTNPDNTAIGARSFGSDPELVAAMVSAEVAAMLVEGTLPCVKHFPGHGDTNADSHTGAAISERTLDELESCEFEPFRAAVAAGVPFVMVGHISTPNAAADGVPASLSSFMMQRTLREELGFAGVIISDSFRMGAITQYFGPADAAVAFLGAGGDMVLMPEDLRTAYQGVLDAVGAGTLSEGRIDESVLRILDAKQQAGMLS